MKKNLLTLAKELEFNSEIEYFDYLIECHTNGNFEQCKKLFLEMRHNDQKGFLNYLNGQAYYNGLLQVRKFYFDLI